MITRSMKRSLSLSYGRHKKRGGKDGYAKMEKVKNREEKKRIQSPVRLVPLDRSDRTIPSSATKAKHAASRIRSVWPFSTSSRGAFRNWNNIGASVNFLRRNVVGFSRLACMACNEGAYERAALSALNFPRVGALSFGRK